MTDEPAGTDRMHERAMRERRPGDGPVEEPSMPGNVVMVMFAMGFLACAAGIVLVLVVTVRWILSAVA